MNTEDLLHKLFDPFKETALLRKEDVRLAIEEAEARGFARGQLAEIEANAVSDITIAKEKVEQIRSEARRDERERIYDDLNTLFLRARDADERTRALDEYLKTHLPSNTTP